MENYNSGAITVLSGLEPVRKRPAMYTDISASSYSKLAHEIMFASIEDALRGEVRSLLSSVITTLGFAENTAKPICFIEVEVELPQTTHPRSDVCKVPLSWTELLKITRKLGREPPKANAALRGKQRKQLNSNSN
ncbi:hypothetical protein DU976_20795 [Vibrio navarrensis]|nr:hypothetical protein [Vibrio navarrensis]EJL6396909.1 hypothetical protein [Vibrio navarrensis]